MVALSLAASFCTLGSSMPFHDSECLPDLPQSLANEVELIKSQPQATWCSSLARGWILQAKQLLWSRLYLGLCLSCLPHGLPFYNQIKPGGLSMVLDAPPRKVSQSLIEACLQRSSLDRHSPQLPTRGQQEPTLPSPGSF